MKRKKLYAALALIAAFILWTAVVSSIDVQAIGPQGSRVGLSAVNGWFHGLTGVHMTLYTVTDWLGLVPVAVVMAFAMLGLIQWIKRKRLFLVDSSILILGGFYVIVMGAYLLFEELVINYRPVLIGGYLESSYPSSTTLLVLCVMLTALIQFRARIKNNTMRQSITVMISVFTAFMVIGRLFSGVHWLSDIIGGALLSAGLIMLYNVTVTSLQKHFKKNISKS